MEITMEIISDLFQTIAILFALFVAIFELKRTRTSNRVNTYNSIISMMNNLRDFRIKDPELERALFTGRSTWTDVQIKTRVYAVELANIFELVFLSRKAGLIEKSVWDEWILLWKTVILSDKAMRDLLKDPTIYTFSRLDACEEVRKISENEDYVVPDPNIGFFRELFYKKIIPPVATSSIPTDPKDKNFEQRWLKMVEVAGKILSVLSGIAIIVFVSLLTAGKAQIGNLQVENLLPILSFTLIGGLLSIGGVNILSVNASLRQVRQQLVEVRRSISGGCPFALIVDDKAKEEFGVKGPFEITDEHFCARCHLRDHKDGQAICTVSPAYRKSSR